MMNLDSANATSTRYCWGNQDSASAPAQHPHNPCPYGVGMWHRIEGRQDSASALVMYRGGRQDSASAPAQHRATEPGQRKRPHTASQQPLSLRDGNLAPEIWWNPIPASQSVSERGV